MRFKQFLTESTQHKSLQAKAKGLTYAGWNKWKDNKDITFTYSDTEKQFIKANRSIQDLNADIGYWENFKRSQGFPETHPDPKYAQNRIYADKMIAKIRSDLDKMENKQSETVKDVDGDTKVDSLTLSRAEYDSLLTNTFASNAFKTLKHNWSLGGVKVVGGAKQIGILQDVLAVKKKQPGDEELVKVQDKKSTGFKIPSIEQMNRKPLQPKDFVGNAVQYQQKVNEEVDVNESQIKELENRIKEQEAKWNNEYKQLMKLPKEEVLARVGGVYRIHSHTKNDSKMEMVYTILSRQYNIGKLRERLKKLRGGN